MRRTLLGTIAIGVAVWIGINLLYTSDREKVEEETERLLLLARRGGEEASEAILAALADSYRGTMYSREEVGGILAQWVSPARLASLDWGAVHATWKDGEFLVPLRITARTRLDAGTILVTVLFAEEQGSFRVVDVTRWK